MKNIIKTFVIAILSIIATIIVCNINMNTTAHAETYDIEEAYDLVNKEMELYSNCYNENDGTFNVDYDTACEITQLEAEYYSHALSTSTETQTTTTTTTTTITEEQTTTTTTIIEEQTTEEEQTTTAIIEKEQTTTTTEEEQVYTPCNQCKEEANEYVNQTAQIYNSVFDGTNFNVDYDTACKLVELEFKYYSTSHEQHEQTTTEELATSETNLNSAYDYVNQEAAIYSSCYDGYDFNIDYNTACEIVQLQMEYYSK